jgi:outer membrane murein-binding lipoprotein Lpp
VPWWTWLSLGVFALSLLGVGIFAAFAVGRMRQLAPVVETLRAQADELNRGAGALERRRGQMEARREDLERARARLDTSLAQLSVLRWGLSDARRDARHIRTLILPK